MSGDRGIGTRKDGHFGSAEHYARCERQRLEGEPLIDAIIRIIYEDFCRAYGSRTTAAAVLGTTRRSVQRHLRAAIQAKLNVEKGRSDLNRRWGYRRHPTEAA